jgi:hypothetical protein
MPPAKIMLMILLFSYSRFDEFACRKFPEAGCVRII